MILNPVERYMNKKGKEEGIEQGKKEGKEEGTELFRQKLYHEDP